MLRLEIRGANSPEKYAEVARVVPSSHLYRQGTETALYADMPNRERAHLAMVNLNQIHGVTAKILNDQYPDKS